MENMDNELRCEICGEVISENDEIVCNSTIYCERCASEHLYYCDHCDEWYNDDDYYNVHLTRNHTETWCSNCVNHDAFFCDDCGEWYADSYYYSYEIANRGNLVCEACYRSGDYIQCNDCGNYVDEYWEGADGYDYCENCIDSHRYKAIWGYSEYRGEKDWKHHCDTAFTDERSSYADRRMKLHKGIEWEISNGGTDDDNAIAITAAMNFPVDESDELICAEDSSLREGIEVISNPCTTDYHLQVIDWQAGMNKAKDLGYVSHDGGRCGIHFHLDRYYFEQHKDIVEKELVVLLTNNSGWLKKFSRREEYRYCQFKEMKPFTYEDAASNYVARNNDIQELLDFYHGCREQGSHGVAMNLTGYDTIEMRFIRGTLRYETFVAAMQLMDLIGHFIKHTEFTKIPTIDLHDFKELAETLGFKAFLEYLDYRNINEEVEF